MAFLEGLSYVLLLFVAMPLKYMAGEPLAVRLLGMVHGGLFCALFLLTWQGVTEAGRSLGWGVRIGIASLLPFGTFFLDRRLKAEDEAFRSARADSADSADS